MCTVLEKLINLYVCAMSVLDKMFLVESSQLQALIVVLATGYLFWVELFWVRVADMYACYITGL